MIELAFTPGGEEYAEVRTVDSVTVTDVVTDDTSVAVDNEVWEMFEGFWLVAEPFNGPTVVEEGPYHLSQWDCPLDPENQDWAAQTQGERANGSDAVKWGPGLDIILL